MRRVAIVTDDPGWHGARLRRAFKARGIDARYVSLTRCRVDLSGGTDGIVMGGFERGLPHGVFVRGVPGGTLEQVVLRLDFLHLLGELGIPVYNAARAIEKSVDKAMTSLLLKRAGVPTPPTWTTEDPTEARHILLRETAGGGELVLKPLFGSQGKGLRRLRAGDGIPDAETVGGVWYFQRYLPCPDGQWRDWRVLVAGDAVVAAMCRHGRSWINNVAQGARCAPCLPDDAMRRIAVDAARALQMDYAGVDLMRDADGNLKVIEVNSIPAWKGLQGVTPFDIADRLVEDFVRRQPAQRLELAC